MLNYIKITKLNIYHIWIRSINSLIHMQYRNIGNAPILYFIFDQQILDMIILKEWNI